MMRKVIAALYDSIYVFVSVLNEKLERTKKFLTADLKVFNELG